MGNRIIKGYKGFDKDMKCLGLQYEIGKEMVVDEAKLCNCGLHFCENPHDVFGYYGAGNGNKFAVVEATDVSDEHGADSKRAAKRLTVKAEISVFKICKIAVSTFFGNFGFKEKIKGADSNNADSYGAANAGDCGAANAGYKGAANAGSYGAVIVSNNGRVKGGMGCVLVARDIKWNEDNDSYEVIDWAAEIVDGDKIKADTWYHLENGKLVECEKDGENEKEN